MQTWNLGITEHVSFYGGETGDRMGDPLCNACASPIIEAPGEKVFLRSGPVEGTAGDFEIFPITLNEDERNEMVAKALAEARSQLLKDRGEAHRFAVEQLARAHKGVRIAWLGIIVSVVAASIQASIFMRHPAFVYVITWASFIVLAAALDAHRRVCGVLRECWTATAAQCLAQRQAILDHFPRMGQ